MQQILVMLPLEIKQKIALYLRTPAADIIQKEIKRVLTIIKRDKLYTEQTIWSIMSINWYEYYETDEKRYRQENRRYCNINMLSNNELKKAKIEHVIFGYDMKIQETDYGDDEYCELLRLKNAHMKQIYFVEDSCNKLCKKKLEYSLWIDYNNAFYAKNI